MSSRSRKESPASGADRRHDNSLTSDSSSGGRCRISLAVIVALAFQGGHLAEAFQTSLPKVSSTSRTRSRPTHLHAAYSSSVEEPQILPGLFGHDRAASTSSGSHSGASLGISMISGAFQSNQMFLKSSRVSLQPISSLSSDFYDSTTTLTRKPVTEDTDSADVSLQKPTRSRGVLGFAILDHGDHIISSSRVPIPMEESSTSLKASSQQEQQRPATKVDVQTWGGKQMDSEWIASAHHRESSSPILNRSPSSSSTSGISSENEATNIPAWFPWLPTMEQIKELKVKELQWVCGERGLKKAGNKAELQERLWHWTRHQQQRRLVIGSSSNSPANRLVRYQQRGESLDSLLKRSKETDSSSSNSNVNSLGEWARTYNIEPLLQRREKIHKEKREGKAVPKRKEYKPPGKGGPDTPTKEYLSKLFAASASQYSNFEVKEMYAAAKAADQAGDRIMSKQILYKLKDATPHDARIYRRLCRMEQEEGNIHRAREILQEGIRLHPRNAHLWQGLGQLEAKSGDGKEARKCFEKAIELDPAFPNPYHALGTLEHTQGHIAKAMKVLKKGLEYCPTNHRLHHALGDLYREAKMLDMAERSFRRALEHGREVNRCFAYTSLAHVAFEQDQKEKCRTWLRKAVAVNDGRHAKGWVALANFEESEKNYDAARNVCMTALNQYERELIKRGRRSKHLKPISLLTKNRELVAQLSDTPIVLKNKMLKNVPVYRSGDHFLKVYRNWARLEERHGSPEVVDEIYNRASIAFPIDWKLTLDWARYHSRSGHDDQARLLFMKASEKVSSRHADPYRIYAEFEMGLGNYQDARRILYRGAVAMSHCSDGGLGNRGGMAELFHSWAICEWHLNNLSRSEVLFDHALRLTDSGGDGSRLRSMILHSIARLEYARKEYHLAQHCICLCLKENSLPGGKSVLWDLWANVATDMGDQDLARRCEEQAKEAIIQEEDTKADGLSMLLKLGNPVSSGLSTMKGPEMESVMRKDPWHYKIFGVDSSSSSSSFFSGVALPED